MLFDLDGVLVDSRRCVELVWEAWARGRGFDAAAILRAAHGRRTSEVLREVLPQLDVAAEAARLDALEAAERRGVEPVPGASALVAALPRSRWAVVTSCSPSIARLRLAVARIPAPPVLVTGADVRRGKPDPEGYLRAARTLGADPGRCIVVEDAPAGIAAGRAAGMRVIAVRGTFADEQLAGADAVIGGVGELRVERTEAEAVTLAWGEASRTPPPVR